jgi:hypothetical protein
VVRESTILVNICCCAHANSRTFLGADALKMSAFIDADSRTDVDATVPALTGMHVLTQTPTYTHADSFLRLLLRTVYSSRLTSMRRFAAPTMWGFEIHFAASDPLILMWGSQLTSVHFCTGHCRDRLPPGTEKTICLLSGIHLFSLYNALKDPTPRSYIMHTMGAVA